MGKPTGGNKGRPTGGNKGWPTGKPTDRPMGGSRDRPTGRPGRYVMLFSNYGNGIVSCKSNNKHKCFTFKSHSFVNEFNQSAVIKAQS